LPERKVDAGQAFARRQPDGDDHQAFGKAAPACRKSQASSASKAVIRRE